jgi:MFS family permease
MGIQRVRDRFRRTADARGSWTDRSGRKRAFIAGFVLFTAASAACALAPSLGVLVAARIA